MLKVKLEEGAIFKKNNDKDTGFDVAVWRFCDVRKNAEGKRAITHLENEEYSLMPNRRITIDTGVSAEWDSLKGRFDSGLYSIDAQIRGRSGMNLDGTLCQFGTIDEIYRGRVCATIINLSDEEIILKKGERIAQIVIGYAYNPEIQIVDTLDDTARGKQGFGSSGK